MSEDRSWRNWDGKPGPRGPGERSQVRRAGPTCSSGLKMTWGSSEGARTSAGALTSNAVEHLPLTLVVWYGLGSPPHTLTGCENLRGGNAPCREV